MKWFHVVGAALRRNYPTAPTGIEVSNPGFGNRLQANRIPAPL